jgi:hypothetical protein
MHVVRKRFMAIAVLPASRTGFSARKSSAMLILEENHSMRRPGRVQGCRLPWQSGLLLEVRGRST